MHGVAMALRKKGGGAPKTCYCMQWQWLLGMFCDALAGVLLMMSVSFAPAFMVLPAVAASQMFAGHLIGLLCFEEPCSRLSCMGLACAVVGVLLFGGRSSTAVVPAPVSELAKHITQPHFLVMNGALLGLAFAMHVRRVRSMMYVFLAAHADGLQFLATRILAGTLLRGKDVLHPAILMVCCVKGVCLVAVLHFQQLALQDNLASVSVAYPLIAAVVPCLFGVTFFGDHLIPNPEILAALTVTLLAIVLLAAPPHKTVKAADDIAEPFL